MDLLQKELLRKKQAWAKAKEAAALGGGGGGGKDGKGNLKGRFLKAGEIRRIQEEQEEEQRRQAAAQLFQKKRPYSSVEQPSTSAAIGGGGGGDSTSNAQEPQDESTNNEEPKKKKKKKKKKHGLVEGGDPQAPLTKEPEEQENSRPDQASRLSKTFKDNNNAPAQEQKQQNEMTVQLRQLGLPIRLFGETMQERAARLQLGLEQQTHMLLGVSEMDEFRLGRGHGIRNPFLEKEIVDDTTRTFSNTNNDQPNSDNHKDNGSTNAATIGTNDNKTLEAAAADEEDANDIPKKIYNYLKGLLRQWEDDLAQRPDHVKKSVTGRNESKTLKQCKDYIRPLFKLCKTRRLEPSLQAHLNKIVGFAQQGEFVMAHDAYIDVAIGRAAWPIGVTMVGIHARSGRAKIESANVAHVMNSELQRKYLTSVKRLLTYAQKKRTDVDPSKKVL
jgi:pre-mRNA-splicing factor 18